MRDQVRYDELRLRRQWRNGTEEPFAHWCGTGIPSRGSESPIQVNRRDPGRRPPRRTPHRHGRREPGPNRRSCRCRPPPPGASPQGGPTRSRQTRGRVVDADGTDYTQARSHTDISVADIEETRAVGVIALNLGPVEVVTQVTGHQLRCALSQNPGQRDTRPSRAAPRSWGGRPVATTSKAPSR